MSVSQQLTTQVVGVSGNTHKQTHGNGRDADTFAAVHRRDGPPNLYL